MKKLGKLPAKKDPRALLFANFVAPKSPPKEVNFWKHRTKFPLRSFGNTEIGDCTIASQAVMSMRMERLEVRRTPIVSDKSVTDAYYDLTNRLYGGGDTGAYEEDALANWRNPDKTFKDTKGRALTIDAFTRINHLDIEEVKLAMFLSQGKGIKVCFNLPKAVMHETTVWNIPKGQPLTGDWEPGSWGGHSMYTNGDYDDFGFTWPTTWDMPDITISWQFFSFYCDEANSIIDSVDYWRKVKKLIDLDKIRKEVNKVSSIKL